MGQPVLSLRETVRQYPAKERLSDEATALFQKTFKGQPKSVSAQAAFVAAKAAVNSLPKDRRYKPADEDE